ncbi:hypothetical protein CYMTET_52015 [Cymbomonas tetramitiformis]|uniref:Uncharacterized protein n=1 Tax=Cymbomonas tetramitiformis TaxID=36881 RepID=A0AAE0ER80_9CHLO|nr:hypothetical protein CYMTET_52015 [Cymbomonas tetramitiformis]
MDWLMDEKDPPSMEELGESRAVLTKRLKEFDNQKVKAVMNTHAKASAKNSSFRDLQGEAKALELAKVKAGAVMGGAAKGQGFSAAPTPRPSQISIQKIVGRLRSAPQGFQQKEPIHPPGNKGRMGASERIDDDMFISRVFVSDDRAGGCVREERAPAGARVLPYARKGNNGSRRSRWSTSAGWRSVAGLREGGTVPRDAGEMAEDSSIYVQAKALASQRGVEAAAVAASPEACSVLGALPVSR